MKISKVLAALAKNLDFWVMFACCALFVFVGFALVINSTTFNVFLLSGVLLFAFSVMTCAVIWSFWSDAISEVEHGK